MGVNFNIVRALVKRDLRMYFSSPSGYVFITLFIFLSAAAAFWQDRFFLSNLANLDQLNALFPHLLVLFVPALTMAVWSEERKLGTDELLLTLPATDLEVVLGKYLAALGVYTGSLLLSLSHIIVLMWLGSPDLGLMVGNYLGFWLLGAALVAVGMLGSLLTANATIAFILGAVLCVAILFLDTGAALFSQTLGAWLEPLSVFRHFADFARGIVSLSGVLYFVSLGGLFLYLNVLLIGRRHWPRAADGVPMWTHQVVRALAVVLLLISVNAVVARASARLDVTAERLHTLTDETRDLVDELAEDRPVLIRAFVSPEVPEQYVQTRANLLGLLREIDVLAGPTVEVIVHDTELYTDVARDAREQFGITPRQVPNMSSARAGFSDVFLGLAFTCGAEEQVIPFFDRGLPAEYEIARSIRVVARTERKRIGVINTAIRLFGGLDFQTMRSTPPWSVVEELRKQYEVVEITPSSPITEELDGLLVVLPSSLSQEEMDHVREEIETGTPALLLVDPLPTVNIGLAPAEQPGANTNPFMQQNQPPPTPKGDVQAMLAGLGLRWDSTSVAWDAYNPHPDLAHLPPEVVFVGEGNGAEMPFSREHPASGGLQELVFLYPGHLGPAAGSDYEFEPLVRSGLVSGNLSYFQMVQRSFFGTQLNPSLPHIPDGGDYVLAAHVRGTVAPPAEDEVEAASEDEAPVSEAPPEPDAEPAEETGGIAASPEEAAREATERPAPPPAPDEPPTDAVSEPDAAGAEATPASPTTRDDAAPATDPESEPSTDAPAAGAAADAAEVDPAEETAVEAPTEPEAPTPAEGEQPVQPADTTEGTAPAADASEAADEAGVEPQTGAADPPVEVQAAADEAPEAEEQPAGESPEAEEQPAGEAPETEEQPAGEAPETEEQPADEATETEAVDDEAAAEAPGSVDVIVVADIDFISEQFFGIREVGAGNLNFDNVSFFLNAIDVLVDDPSFIALRNRRIQHRTLSLVEEQTRAFVEQRAAEEQQAESEAEQALAEAQQRLDERVQEVRDRPDLDDRTKQIMARNLQEVENRRFEALRTGIEAEKEAKIQSSMENMESQVRRIQSQIRTLAVLLPPIPVFALGLVIFARRQQREREGAAAARRIRS